jgi:SAM-dependent methyltransferase
MSNKGTDPAWRVIVERSAFFNDAEYGRFVSKWSFDYYRKRLLNVGFGGMERVIDVGCGHGHWTCALASLNEEVVGIDIHQHRVQIGAELIRDLWIDNASTKVGDAMAIPFEDAEFDGLFCYGVFMFLNPDEALAEFRRVLKPGGKLYICTNGPGWWLSLSIKQALKNRSVSRTGWAAFCKSRTPGTPSSLSCSDMLQLLQRNDFVGAKVAPEGSLLVGERSEAALKPVYPPSFLGLDNVTEAVACKAGVCEMQRGNSPLQAFPILREVHAALISPFKSYVADLERFKSDDTGELTNATHAPRLSYARACSGNLDRHGFLEACVAMATKDVKGDVPRIRALVKLCQKVFYHHFATQPIDAGALVDDPIEVLAMRAARCGSAARFLVDLLEVSGFKAGLIAGACHTAAEVYFGGEWRLIDPSLYPAGTVLLDATGELLRTSQALTDPACLDRPPSYINYNCGHIDVFCSTYPKTAAAIEKYLRYPILPSIGYFGREFAGDRAGRLSRYRKQLKPVSGWSPWTTLELVEELQAPSLPTQYRPEQVQAVELRGKVLHWPPARTQEQHSPVVYDVYVCQTSRGWGYARLPDDCQFEIPGVAVRTAEVRADVGCLLCSGSNYATVIARNPEAIDAFHLPSDEFVIYA